MSAGQPTIVRYSRYIDLVRYMPPTLLSVGNEKGGPGQLGSSCQTEAYEGHAYNSWYIWLHCRRQKVFLPKRFRLMLHSIWACIKIRLSTKSTGMNFQCPAAEYTTGRILHSIGHKSVQFRDSFNCFGKILPEHLPGDVHTSLIQEPFLCRLFHCKRLCPRLLVLELMVNYDGKVTHQTSLPSCLQIFRTNLSVRLDISKLPSLIIVETGCTKPRDFYMPDVFDRPAPPVVQWWKPFEMLRDIVTKVKPTVWAETTEVLMSI